jgi:hypothetical protein
MLKIPKFEVGDKVRILRASTDEEYDLWGDAWCDSWMGENIGKVLIVNDLQNWDNCYEYCKYRLNGYWYPEFVLENEIRVGEQLLFSFMKE